MPVDAKIEISRDIQKIQLQTVTRQDVADFDANSGLRSWRKEHVDGVTTIIEESYIDSGTEMWSIDATTSTEPLESHWIFTQGVPDNIKTYWLAWKRNAMDPSLAQALTSSTNSYWDPAIDGIKNQNFSLFYSRWKYGFDSYLSPRIVGRKAVLETNPPDASKVGLIADSVAFPFDFPVGVTFLLTSIRGQEEGEFWRNTYEYLGSNPNTSFPNESGGATRGWDTLVYSQA
jgi:hypothetical protein